MIGRLLATHRSMVVTLASSLALAVAIGTTALFSNGYTAQRMHLDDGAVWVVNDTEQAVGRANPVVGELNSVVAAQGSDLEVVQQGSTILLVDRSNASLDVIDPATSEAGDTVALPPEQPEVWIAGSNAVILAQGTGELWIVPLTELQTFDPTTAATYTFGKKTVATVDSAGVLYAYSSTAGEVYRVDAATAGSDDQRFPLVFPSSAQSFAITAVGGNWAVLDQTDRRIGFQDSTVDLSDRLPAGITPALEQPAADGSAVLVAGGDRLLAVPMTGGSPETLVSGQSGAPAAPVVRGGCVWAAWSGSGAWTRCADQPGRRIRLESLDGSAKLTFTGDQTAFVLNDTRSGDSWAVAGDGSLIDNWQELLKKDRDRQIQDNDEDKPPQTEQQEQPPVAVPDQLGARPGKATVLPVLLNDYDPNGDVLVIDSVDPPSAETWHVDMISNDQQLLITLSPHASGVIEFHYTIDDGRGGTASALVTVTVKQPWQNSPPVQVRTTKTTVQQGGQVTTQVLGDWIDPDGDAMYLVSAGATAPDRTTSQPDGVVLFTDSGQGAQLKSVPLEVSDGTATGTGSLAVTVRKAGSVPIIADPFVVDAYAGQPVTVSPLEHVRGGNATIRLNAVPASTGVTIVPSFDKGTFTFTSDQVRTHLLEYVVTDGTQTVTGQIRVDVSSPPTTDSKPITIPKTVFVHFNRPTTVDVADTDIDPAGGVLVVTGVTQPADGAVRAEILEQRIVRVTAVAPLGEPVVLQYTVTNGAAEAVGTITVVQVQLPSLFQPPIARDDSVNVRAGDVVDIPVLDNDEQPDGEDVTLDPDLAKPLPAGDGLLFASGDHLRYLAPKTAGNYSAVYQISSAGQHAQATVHIAVREKDASTNNAPVPAPVTARVTAGQTVRIAIPLTGIDPDGDSVQLVGQASPPEKGVVEDVGESWFDYQAGNYSSGTDTFTYTVIDGLGATATGTVRVGIAPRTTGGENPVAVPDEVTVRPNRSVSVQVLENDSDPEGGVLTVTRVDIPDRTSGLKAKIVDGRIVTITPPSGSGKRDYSVSYTIENATGGQSSAFVTVHVDPNAPPARPVASDSVVTVTDVVGRTTIDVPVLDNVFFADGPVTSLGVSVLPGWTDDATVLPDKRIRVAIEKQSQVIPFAVANPDDPRIKAYAFIHVPGLDDALPQLNTKASPITVKSEQTVTIDLNDYVVAIGNGTVRLTGSASVSATHSNGAPLVVDDHTLQFTSAPQYYGPATITFEVTDGSPSDPTARRAILSLPIKVLPRTNQPPVFLGAQLDIEPDVPREIDLTKLTDYPYQNDVGELTYTVADPQPSGVSYQLNGQRLVITADATDPPGTTSSITLGVKDDVNTGKAGVIQLRVVESTKPLAAPIADYAIAPRGQTTVVDVLANDQSGNPFPNTPLRVVQVAGADQGSLPPGITATPSPDNSRISVTVAPDAPAADVNLQYEVADKTNDPSRYVWANVRISVQDRPDPVSGVTVTDFGDRRLTLSWQPGSSNNSAITRYDITGVSPVDGHVMAAASCTGSAGCVLPTPGNGPAYAMRILVSAVNGIGSSDPGALPGTIWSDVIPPAPTALSWSALDGGLRVVWSKPDDGGLGSPITYYVVTVGGTTATVAADPGDAVGTTYSADVISGSPNGSSVGFSVSARNSAPNSLAQWNSASGTGIPAGAPQVTGTPQAAATGPDSASMNWDGVFSANGANITQYFAFAYAGTAPTCSVSGVADGSPSLQVSSGSGITGQVSGTTATFSGLTANQLYNTVVFAYNGQGCTGVSGAQVVTRRPPPTVTGISDQLVMNGDRAWDYQIQGFTSNGPSDANYLKYRLVGSGVDGTTYPLTPPGLAVAQNGSQYGQQVGIQVQGCVNYPEQTLCSTNWSQTFALGVPIQLDVTALAESYPADGALYTPTWSWSASTAGSQYPGYQSAQYSCDGGATWSDLNGGPQTCSGLDQTQQSGGPQLQLRATTGDGTFERDIPWQ